MLFPPSNTMLQLKQWIKWLWQILKPTTCVKPSPAYWGMCADTLSTKEFWCHSDIKIAVSTTRNTWDKPISHHVNGMWKNMAKSWIWREDGSSHHPPSPSITSQVSPAWVTPGLIFLQVCSLTMFILHYFNFSHSRETVISGGQQSKRESIACVKTARYQQRRSPGSRAEVHRVESVRPWGGFACDADHDKGQLTSFSANWQHHGHVWWTLDTPPNFRAWWRLKFYKIYKHKLQTLIQIFTNRYFQRAQASASTSFMSLISTGEPVKLGKASAGLPQPSLSPSESSDNDEPAAYELPQPATINKTHLFWIYIYFNVFIPFMYSVKWFTALTF